jgi:hypothetical protein
MVVIRNNVSFDKLSRMVLEVTCEVNTTWLER